LTRKTDPDIDSDFAGLLRRWRLRAGFSQESLAERAGISADAVSGYERGLRWAPRRETIAALVEALQLTGEARAEFEQAADRRRPEPPSSDKPSHNLPWQRTSFVGRRREIEELSALVAQRRLVTITGAGGVGKTRIAIEVASQRKPPPRDGIWFADLAPLTGGDLVLAKIASLLDPRLQQQDDLLGAMIAAIKHRELLLVLDNCEHVIGPVCKIAGALLDACPRITLLATSRERLGIAGELAYQLPTLRIPAQPVATAGEARGYEALELFAQRAAAAKHGFVLSDEHVEAAADICRRLDGIALAIELAATRVPLLGLAGLRTQLAEHFRVVAGGSRDVPARQQTLWAAIAWSYDLLEEAERMLFRRLAIFANGWTLEAVEAVCTGGALERTSVLEVLLSLVEKSLVATNGDALVPRYSFFESTRAYALECLAAGGEEAELSRRHALWMGEVADRAYGTYLMLPLWRWEMAVFPELDNALAALEWALGPQGDAPLAGRIVSGLRGLWLSAGLAVHGQRYVYAALERIDADEHPALVGRLLLAQCRHLEGKANVDAVKRAALLLERAGDRRSLSASYAFLAVALSQTGKYPEAADACDKALALAREEAPQRSPLHYNALNGRGYVLQRLGRLDEARADITHALSLASEVDDDWTVSHCQAALAELEFDAGNTQRAVSLGEEAIARARRVRAAHPETFLLNLAYFQLVLGEIDAAEANAMESLDLAASSSPDLRLALGYLATIAAIKGRTSRAARLVGYVNAWCERMELSRELPEQKSYDMLMESLRRQLSEDEISVLAAEGARLTEDAAIEEALHR
jgi:predicted ATPase/DNA-binding XRE family transcriptional regulator